MDIRKFKELIAKREKIHPEDYLTIEHCDKELIDVLCEDMPGTIKYLYSECTVEEFLWLSEFFEETVARVPDMGYVDGLRYLVKNTIAMLPVTLTSILFIPSISPKALPI